MHKPCFRILFPILMALLLVFILPGCEPGREKAVPVKEQGLSAREALAYAWPEAQRWNADARLALLRSGQLDDDGRSGEWRITFYRVTDSKELLPPDQITIIIAGGKIAGTRKENPYSFRPDPAKTGVAWRVDSTEAAGLARARGVVLTGGRNKCIASLYAPKREGVGVNATHWTWELQTMHGTVMG
ncbi:MAG: hypothetical protein K6T65_16660, partial [Peptococcaceae bacterium]|nr:hypothetical protein [Peptococcaceae bacterium]